MQPVTNYGFIPWLMLIIGLCIALSSYPEQPSDPAIKSIPLAGPVLDTQELLYSVDRIEEGVATLLPRQPGGKPIQVAHTKLTFADEGDIVGAVSSSSSKPSLRYYLDEGETRRIRGEVEQLLVKLQEQSDN